MAKKINPRISWFLTKRSFYLICGFSLVAGIGQLYIEFLRAERNIELDIQKKLMVSDTVLKKAVFNLDHALSDKIASDFFHSSEDLLAVRIVDELGQNLAVRYRQPVITSKTLWLTKLLCNPWPKIIKAIEISDRKFRYQGAISVLVDKDRALKEFYGRAGLFFLVKIIESFLLSGCLFFLFFYGISLPVNQLAQRFRTMNIHSGRKQSLGNEKSHVGIYELEYLVKCGNEYIEAMQCELAEKDQSLLKNIENERNYRMMIDRLPSMVFILNKDLKIVFANKRFRSKFGHELYDAEGRHFKDFYPFIDKQHRGFIINNRDDQLNDQDDHIAEIPLILNDSEKNIQELHKQMIRFQGEKMYLFTSFDVTERVLAAQKIQHMAFHDALTDLPNRNLFMDRLYQATAHAERLKLFGALLFVDLDNFKQVNDTLGHNFGDEVIRTVGSRLLESVRINDTVARLGGDEFVLVLQTLDGDRDIALEKAMSIADQLRVRLSEPHILGTHKMEVTASIGVVLFPEFGKDIKELLHHADTAMYHAKMGGRDSQVTFKDEMDDIVNRHIELEDALKAGVEEKSFELLYQPIFDCDSLHITGFEALLRWNHGRKGQTLPEIFIPVLESSGMMVTVGQWVVEHACQTLKLLLDKEVWQPSWQMHVNISSRQMIQSNFIEDVTQYLTDNDIPKKLMCFDITEEVLDRDVSNLIKKMQQLKEAGISFSMDHFGQSYGSIRYLRQLPIDRVKIDTDIVKELSPTSTKKTRGSSQQMASGIVYLAREMGLKITAVGVESRDQLSFLKAHQCHDFQGFYASKPLSITDMLEFIKAALPSSTSNKAVSLREKEVDIIE